MIDLKQAYKTNKFIYKFIKNIYFFFKYYFPFNIFFNLYAKFSSFFFYFYFRNKKKRFLDIGADYLNPIENFENLSIDKMPNIHYTLDASRKMFFKNNTFDLIYASHILEHIPFYKINETLKEWKRILKKKGTLYIWVPDGYKICKHLVDNEDYNYDYSNKDNYYECVNNKDPKIWTSLRIYAHGDGRGKLNHPNWHRAIFTKSLLIKYFKEMDFENIRLLENKDNIGRGHGWIDLGISGQKK